MKESEEMEKITGYPIEKKQLRAKQVTVDGIKKIIDDCYNRYCMNYDNADKNEYAYKIMQIALEFSEESDSNVFIDNGTADDTINDVIGYNAWEPDTIFNDESDARKFPELSETLARVKTRTAMCDEDCKITGWKMVKGTAVALVGMVAEYGICNSYCILYVGANNSLHFYIPVNGNTYFHEYGLANNDVDIAYDKYREMHPNETLDSPIKYDVCCSDDFRKVRNAVMPPPNLGAMLSEFADQLIVVDMESKNTDNAPHCVNAKRGVTRNDWKKYFATNYPHDFDNEYWADIVDSILRRNGLEEITTCIDEYCFGLDASHDYDDGFCDINGTVVFCMIIGGDEETDVAMCLYFDKDGQIQVYYPEDGNTFDKERRVAYNVHEIDEFDDVRFAYGDVLDYEYASSVWNPKAMLDDIKQHIVTE